MQLYESHYLAVFIINCLLICFQQQLKHLRKQIKLAKKNNFNQYIDKREFFADCFPLITEGIIIMNENKEIVFSNNQAKKILNCPEKLMIDKLMLMNLQPDKKPLLQQIEAQVMQIFSDQSIKLNKDEVISQINKLNTDPKQLLTKSLNPYIKVKIMKDKQDFSQKLINCQQISEIFDLMLTINHPCADDQNIKSLQNIDLMFLNPEIRARHDLSNDLHLQSSQRVSNLILNQSLKRDSSNNENIFSILNIYNNNNDLILVVNVVDKEKQLQIKIIQLQFTDNIQVKQHQLFGFIIEDPTQCELFHVIKEENVQSKNMLAQVSHEFRTPLNCSILMLEQLKKELKKQQIYQFLDPSLNSQKILLNFVNDILDFSQINAGKFSLNFVNCNLRKVFHQAISLIQIQAQMKQIGLVCHIDPKVPKYFYTDPLRLRQVIINLLGNSLKFTKVGQIRVNVILKSAQSPILLNVSIEDTGIGISTEHQHHLFKVFGKINNDVSKKLNAQGVGLGLVISNALVQGLGPSETKGLQLESKVNVGTKFFFDLQNKNEMDLTELNFQDQESSMDNTSSDSIEEQQINEPATQYYHIQNEYFIDQTFTAQTSFSNFSPNLPKVNSIKRLSVSKINQLAPQDQQSSPDPINQSMLLIPLQSSQLIKMINDNKRNCTCPNVLIVDDNQFNILALITILKKFFKQLDYCFSGETAFEKVENKMKNSQCCKYYQIIFMDIEMPGGMNGYETTQKIKTLYQQFESGAYQVVGCSGYSNQIEKQTALSKGMDYYISKPIDKKNLKKILYNIFKIR